MMKKRCILQSCLEAIQMSNNGKPTNNPNTGKSGNHSQRGSNVPTQPTVPKMPPVKPNTSKK